MARRRSQTRNVADTSTRQHRGMELGTPHLVVAPAHPSLDGAVAPVLRRAARRDPLLRATRFRRPEADGVAGPAPRVAGTGHRRRRPRRRRTDRAGPHRRRRAGRPRTAGRRRQILAGAGRGTGAGPGDRRTSPPGGHGPHRPAHELPPRRTCASWATPSASRSSTSGRAVWISCARWPRRRGRPDAPRRPTRRIGRRGVVQRWSARRRHRPRVSPVVPSGVVTSPPPVSVGVSSSSSSSLHPAKAVTANKAAAIPTNGFLLIVSESFPRCCPLTRTLPVGLSRKRHTWRHVPGVTSRRRGRRRRA